MRKRARSQEHVYYQGVAARQGRSKPKAPKPLPDRDLLLAAQEAALANVSSAPAGDRWANRDRSKPAGKWSGKA